MTDSVASELQMKLLLWMARMWNLRIIYVYVDKRDDTRVQVPGIVTHVYESIALADLKLDNGKEISGARPSFVDTKHGINGVHPFHFFPESGRWPGTTS